MKSLWLTVVVFLLSILALDVSGAFAQTNVRVLGVGKLAFDVATPTASDAQAQTYKVYMPATATTGIALTGVICSVAVSPTPPGQFTCTFPLSALPLTASFQSLALTASLVAPDGTLESPKSTAPFALGLAAPPVAPALGMSIRPANP